MTYICICTNNLNEQQYLKLKISDRLDIGINFSDYDYIHQIPIEPEHDVYILKINNDKDFAGAVALRSAAPRSAIVVLSDTDKYAIKSYQLDSKGYLLTPFKDELVDDVIRRTHRDMRERIMIINAADGIVRVNSEELNYINIEGRRLCYHMSDGDEIYSKSLRESFAATLKDSALGNRDYIFLPPAVIVNERQIKKIDKEKVIFRNGDFCYLSKMQNIFLKKKINGGL